MSKSKQTDLNSSSAMYPMQKPKKKNFMATDRNRTFMEKVCRSS